MVAMSARFLMPEVTTEADASDHGLVPRPRHQA